MDKARNVRTAVAKRSAVTDEFRTFDMEAPFKMQLWCPVAVASLVCWEVIAGEADTVVEVTEFGLKLQFDFRKAWMAWP